MKFIKKTNEAVTSAPEQNDQQPAQKKGVRIALKIGNIIINTLIILVLITSVVIATLALTSKANDGVPQIFGHSFHTIMSPSMEGGSDQFEGGNYNVGDLVIGKATKGNTNEVYEIGDIVVYTTKNDNTPDGVEMIVHRVVAREQNDNGTYIYTTKGDNNPTEDTATHTAADIVAVTYDHDYNGAILRGVGNALNYIRSSQGFFLVVLLPMIIFFLYEIVRVVMNALSYKKSKSEEDKADVEREKQEAVEAAVKAALAAVGKDGAAPAAESAPQENAETPAGSSPDDSAEAPAAPAPEMSAEQLEQFKQFLAFQEAQKAQQRDCHSEERSDEESNG